MDKKHLKNGKMTQKHQICTRNPSAVRYITWSNVLVTNTFETATTLQDVRLELAKEDVAQATQAGTELPKLLLTGFLRTYLWPTYLQ